MRNEISETAPLMRQHWENNTPAQACSDSEREVSSLPWASVPHPIKTCCGDKCDHLYKPNVADGFIIIIVVAHGDEKSKYSSIS